MKSSLLKINDRLDIQGFIRSIIFFSVYYLYIWLYINPALYYQNQKPVFLVDERFFNQFLSYPGGLTEYLSAFISQFYIYQWIGALCVTGIICLITLSTSIIIKSISAKKEVQIIQFIPALLLLSLHSSYEYSLAVSLGMLIALLFIILYLKFTPENRYIRISLFLFYAIAVFHLTAGPLALFISICFLYELIKKRQIVITLCYLIIGLIIFYIAPIFFLIPAGDVFLNLVSSADEPGPENIRYILYLFFPVIFLLLVFGSKTIDTLGQKNELIDKIQSFFNKKQLVYYQPLILVLLMVVVAYLSYNREQIIKRRE